MPDTELYVIAAGNGSRIKENVPKALLPIADEPCLTTTLRRIGWMFGRVSVITNVLMLEQWNAYFDDLRKLHPESAARVRNLPIRSGLGDGHAILEGMAAAERSGDPECTADIVVVWGDVFFNNGDLVGELLSKNLIGSGLVPAVRERDPYVSLLVDDHMNCKAADFSKYGERHAVGLHDQSVFRFDLARLKRALRLLHNAMWKNGKYLTSGGELSLLHSFHLLHNIGDPVHVYETLHAVMTFNTMDEITAIRQGVVKEKVDLFA